MTDAPFEGGAPQRVWACCYWFGMGWPVVSMCMWCEGTDSILRWYTAALRLAHDSNTRSTLGLIHARLGCTVRPSMFLHMLLFGYRHSCMHICTRARMHVCTHKHARTHAHDVHGTHAHTRIECVGREILYVTWEWSRDLECNMRM